jgi:hypothetical protein
LHALQRGLGFSAEERGRQGALQFSSDARRFASATSPARLNERVSTDGVHERTIFF